MLSGDSQCFHFCPFVPSVVNMVRNLLWPSPRFCEMQTARGTLKTASNTCISFHGGFFTEGNLYHNGFFFLVAVLHFDVQIRSNSATRARVISAWGKPLITEAATAEGKGRAAHSRQGADCQPGQGKGFHSSNKQTSDFLMKATSPERVAHYTGYLITEASYGFKLAG